MSGGYVAAAVVGAAIVGAGSAYYQGEETKRLAEQDASRREEEAALAQAEADRISRETGPDGEALSAITFGSDDGTDPTVGSTSDFLIPKTSSLGSTGLSGLGFTV